MRSEETMVVGGAEEEEEGHSKYYRGVEVSCNTIQISYEKMK